MYSTTYWHISKCLGLFSLIFFLLMASNQCAMPYISPVKTQIQLIHICWWLGATVDQSIELLLLVVVLASLALHYRVGLQPPTLVGVTVPLSLSAFLAVGHPRRWTQVHGATTGWLSQAKPSEERTPSIASKDEVVVTICRSPHHSAIGPLSLSWTQSLDFGTFFGREKR